MRPQARKVNKGNELTKSYIHENGKMEPMSSFVLNELNVLRNGPTAEPAYSYIVCYRFSAIVE